MADKFQLKLIETKTLNDNTVHFVFDILNQQKLQLVAGQFIRLLFEQDGQEVFRSYSVASILQHNTDQISQIELAVSWVKGGLATIGLSQMKIGDEINASAPYGRFCLPEENAFKNYYLIATGTGVTPYRAMTHELMQRIKAGSQVFIVMGAREEAGLLYANEFRQNAKTTAYHYITCLSRSKLENPSNLDFQGHVQNYLKQVEFDATTDIAFLCGNPAMVDESFELLKEKGLPVPQIRREKYVSPPKPKKKLLFNTQI